MFNISGILWNKLFYFAEYCPVGSQYRSVWRVKPLSQLAQYQKRQNIRASEKKLDMNPKLLPK